MFYDRSRATNVLVAAFILHNVMLESRLNGYNRKFCILAEEVVKN